MVDRRSYFYLLDCSPKVKNTKVYIFCIAQLFVHKLNCSHMSLKSQKVTGQTTTPHHSNEVIQMFPMKEIVCIVGRTSWTLMFNDTLLVLCKQLKLEDKVQQT